MALVADYGTSSDEGEDDTSPPEVSTNQQPLGNTSVAEEPDEILEDFVKKTNYGDTLPEKPPSKLPMTGSLSKLRLPNAGKGKIQISIPTLQDSDSDDDQPKVKKTKSTSGAAGFLGSLPAPRASGGAGKEAGRAFIPYTLTKKKPAETKPSTTKSNKTRTKAAKVAAVSTTYSDSDEETIPTDTKGESSSNFFALSSENNYLSVGLPGSVNASPAVASNITAPTVEEEVTQPKITAASLYNMTDVNDDTEYNTYDTNHTSDTNYANEGSNSQIDDLLQNEQFLRLQGKKQRGKEVIDIIDVHTDDQKVSELELTKNISAEVDPSAYAHRKKGDGPSGQQKRKHQITYLAFQAKERELELKNTWAANKATKQQTQAKYGF